MCKVIIFKIAIVVFIAVINFANAGAFKEGSAVYISGYDRGWMKTPLINIWNKFSDRLAGVACKLPGDGKRKYDGKGLGAIVKIIKYSDNDSVKIRSYAKACSGYMNIKYLAKVATKDDCKIEFKGESNESKLAACLADAK